MGKTDFLTNVVTHRAFVFSYNWAMTPVRNRTPLLGHFLAMVPPRCFCAPKQGLQLPLPASCVLMTLCAAGQPAA